MAKRFFTKCYGCFCGHKCGKTPRLPRKTKKKYKNFLMIWDKYRYRHFMDFVTICDIASSYKQDKKLFPLLSFLQKYKNQIDFIRNLYKEGYTEEIYIDENGRLSWYWESDDDYGGSSDIMPFCYSEAEAGRTWAFSEVQSLVRAILDYPDDFVFPEQIKSDKDLLEFVKIKS